MNVHFQVQECQLLTLYVRIYSSHLIICLKLPKWEPCRLHFSNLCQIIPILVSAVLFGCHDLDFFQMIFYFYFAQYVHFLQRKYSLGSFNLLGHTAPVQAASLLLVGPFLDYWLTKKRVDAYNYGFTSTVSFSFVELHALFNFAKYRGFYVCVVT